MDQQVAQNGGQQGNAQAGQALQSLQGLLSAKEVDLPSDIAGQIKEAINGVCSQASSTTRVAVATGKQTWPLQPHDSDAARQATTALRTRLHALLQSTRAVRNHSAYTGALDTRKLHTLKTGNAKLFLRKGERVGVNTAVHILLDASSSMQGKVMDLASQACFAVATALHGLKGISLGVTVFPADQLRKGKQHVTSETVAPILKHGQKTHTNFGMGATGGTPMDAALWWVVQQLHPMPEPRKLILIITDGQPDNEDGAIAAIKAAQGLGFEVLGIGIVAPSISSLLPDKSSRVISGINELAPAMFGMLQNALIAGHPTN